MKKTTIIKSCIRSCPFYGSSMDGMQCNHPYWDDKGAYDNMIITHTNGNNTIPPKCPLRLEDLIIKYHVFYKGDKRIK